ncbi:hypothetical protein P7K49_017288 [Saguinus oedipus]|uniref:Suppressor APC domain-containing protein n=1 Tax=Saguinus oedipus TaxID=9490 RepID=A0ABQ9V4R4_SAGOE|nr:hypothetical protein P7K49_017288 [Saguinus oedipus]
MSTPSRPRRGAAREQTLVDTGTGAVTAEQGCVPPAEPTPSPSNQGLPRAFLQSQRTLFHILDDRRRGCCTCARSSPSGRVPTRELPRGVLQGLCQVTPASSDLIFQRFVAGLRTSLLRLTAAPGPKRATAPQGTSRLCSSWCRCPPTSRDLYWRGSPCPWACSLSGGPQQREPSARSSCAPPPPRPGGALPRGALVVPERGAGTEPERGRRCSGLQALEADSGDARRPRARGERRRLTITCGVDCGLPKQVKELEQEEVLLQGLEMRAPGGDWYQQQQQQERRLGQSRARADFGAAGSPRPLGRARGLGELLAVACASRALPIPPPGPLALP